MEKLNRNSSALKEEIKSLRSFLIGILEEDREGKYRPEFVRKVLKAAREKTIFTFKDKNEIT